MRRGLALDRICLPENVTWHGLLLAFLIPGLGFYLRGPRLWAGLASAFCAPLFLVFIVWLGHPISNVAFGLIVSIHVSGIAYYCGSFVNQWEFRWRVLFSVMLLMSLGFLIYLPLRRAIQDHWFMPVISNGRVVVLEKCAAADIHRGDAVAYTLAGYRFSNHYGNGVSEGEGGISLGPVLAVAGDRVEFSTNGVSINGAMQPALPHMPVSGNFVVSDNHLFVWPNLVMRGNWNPGEGEISAAMLQLSNVSVSQCVGKPLKHWFWRKQIIS